MHVKWTEILSRVYSMFYKYNWISLSKGILNRNTLILFFNVLKSQPKYLKTANRNSFFFLPVMESIYAVHTQRRHFFLSWNWKFRCEWTIRRNLLSLDWIILIRICIVSITWGFRFSNCKIFTKWNKSQIKSVYNFGTIFIRHWTDNIFQLYRSFSINNLFFLFWFFMTYFIRFDEIKFRKLHNTYYYFR